MIEFDIEHEGATIPIDIEEKMSGNLRYIELTASVSVSMPAVKELVDPNDKYSGRTYKVPTVEMVTIKYGESYDVPEGVTPDQARTYIRRQVRSQIEWQYRQRLSKGKL